MFTSNRKLLGKRTDTQSGIIEEINTLFKICAAQNYFMMEYKYCIPMERPTSSLLANIFMVRTQSIQFKKTKQMLFWCRYVDDILEYLLGSDRQNANFYFCILHDMRKPTHTDTTIPNDSFYSIIHKIFMY